MIKEVALAVNHVVEMAVVSGAAPRLHQVLAAGEGEVQAAMSQAQVLQELSSLAMCELPASHGQLAAQQEAVQ